MMNKVELIGRLTRDPDIRSSAGEKPVTIARYTLAVDRRVKAGEEKTADFISCLSFGKNAEFAEKYLRKGLKIAVVGYIRTGSYKNKDGNVIYTTDVVVDEHEFCESKAASSQYQQNTSPAQNDGFVSMNGIDDTELPFGG
jgi:single-strand DNA-binding protein